MNNKNIMFNHTLEQYNKKYRNSRQKLLKFTKKQVEDFDKQYGRYVFNNKTYDLELNHYLLKNRKWALIGDIYYEIPKPVRFTWFRNLNVVVQIGTCVLLAGAIGGGVYGVTYAITHKDAIAIIDNSLSEYLKIKSIDNDKDGNTVIHLSVLKSGFDELIIIKGENKLTVDIEYKYDGKPETGKFEIVVFKETMNKYPGQIVIKTKKPTIDSNNIDWATRKVDGTNTLYNLARNSYKIVIGTNEKYKTTAESLNELKTFDAQETGVKEGSIKAYYGKNSDGQEELYALSDKKIIFEDNDRYGRDMTIVKPEKGRGFFDYCQNCKSIILDNIDTSKVTDFRSTFFCCENLTSINVSNLDTSNATDMSQMFSIGTTRKLTSIIGLEKFNTENVTDMSFMFTNAFAYGPSWGRTTLDISSFSTKSLKNAVSMLSINAPLETIYISQQFNTANIEKSNQMFEGNENLIGGAGTTYDSSHLDKEYARIDGGSEPNKGYFTGISTLEWNKSPQTDKYSFSIDSLRNFRAKYRIEVLEDHLIDSFKICDSDSSEAQTIADGWKVYINGVDSTELFDYDSTNNLIQLKDVEHSAIKAGDVIDFELKLSSSIDKSGFAIAYKS